jgi:hypothetical protein
LQKRRRDRTHTRAPDPHAHNKTTSDQMKRDILCGPCMHAYTHLGKYFRRRQATLVEELFLKLAHCPWPALSRTNTVVWKRAEAEMSSTDLLGCAARPALLVTPVLACAIVSSGGPPSSPLILVQAVVGHVVFVCVCLSVLPAEREKEREALTSDI